MWIWVACLLCWAVVRCWGPCGWEREMRREGQGSASSGASEALLVIRIEPEWGTNRVLYYLPLCSPRPRPRSPPPSPSGVLSSVLPTSSRRDSIVSSIDPTICGLLAECMRPSLHHSIVEPYNVPENLPPSLLVCVVHMRGVHPPSKDRSTRHS